jgi:hypothetical protein
MWPAFPTSEYYDPLRLPLGRPHHFPGSPVIGGASLPADPADRWGQDGSPEFPGRPSARSTPNTPEGSSAPAPRTRAPSVAFAVDEPARHPLSRPKTGAFDDAYSGFTRVADRAVDPAPLRTRPLGHARGLHYRGPRRLPGPDSHRQAAPDLSLLYVMWSSFSSWRRSSLGAPVPGASGPGRSGFRLFGWSCAALVTWQGGPNGVGGNEPVDRPTPSE